MDAEQHINELARAQVELARIQALQAQLLGAFPYLVACVGDELHLDLDNAIIAARAIRDANVEGWAPGDDSERLATLALWMRADITTNGVGREQSLRDQRERWARGHRWRPEEANREEYQLPMPELAALQRDIEQAERATAGLAPAAANIPAPPRIRVHIRRAEHGAVDITAEVNGQEVEVPRAGDIRPFLPRELRRHLSRFDRLRVPLQAGTIPMQVMADAIKARLAALYLQPNEVTAASEEDVSLLRVQPATLLVGGLAYRLVPAGGADMRNPLRRIRQQVREVAIAEAGALRERATEDARLVVSQAEQRAQGLVSEARQRAARAGRAAPEWLAGGDIYYSPAEGSSTDWELLLYINTKVAEIISAIAGWRVTLSWTPLAIASQHPLAVSLRIGAHGEYDLESVRARGGYEAPHISRGRLCMDLQGLPSRVDSLEAYNQVKSILGRGMRVINLNSLLQFDASTWHPDIIAQTPLAVLELLRRQRRRPGADEITRADWPAAEVTWQRETSWEEEGQETFTVPPPQRRTNG